MRNFTSKQHMQTLAFIGSDKNAGKTTALNFEYLNYCRKNSAESSCLTSIGINGEPLDYYDNRPKPAIKVLRKGYFVTAGEHLTSLGGRYRVAEILAQPDFAKLYVLGQAEQDLQLIIEGPNQKHEMLLLKECLQRSNSLKRLFLDGSIDRQFIADPQISDQFCFALLVSKRKEQLSKMENLLRAIALPAVEAESAAAINSFLTDESKSLLLNYQGSLLYRGAEVPFMDEDLIKTCRDNSSDRCLLYLAGALSDTLFSALASFEKLQIVLDNFTLHQSRPTKLPARRKFSPKLSLLHPVSVNRIYLNQKRQMTGLKLPADLEIRNIYRENCR